MSRHQIMSIATASLLAACTASPQPTPGSSNPDLRGLPLPSEVRSELAAEMGALATPQARQACSARELEFAGTSMRLMAVLMTSEETRPWSPTETAAVETLQSRWQSLGGDGVTMSEQCLSAIEPV